MQVLQNISSPSTLQLKHRQLAEDYLKIEENTEFLTHVLRYSHKKQRPRANLEETCIEVRSIAAVCIQLSYLLYTCCIKRTNLLISSFPFLLRPHKRENQAEICLEYLLQKNYYHLSQEEQGIVEKSFKRYEFAHENAGVYSNYILERLGPMIRLARNQEQRLKLPADKAVCKQFATFEIMCNILKGKKLNSPRMAILSFEESELFREYSILVKSMNNSLFSAIRVTKINHLPEIYKIEANYLVSRNQCKPELRHKLMERAIQDTIRVLIKAQILTIEQSVSQQTAADTSTSQQYLFGLVEGQTIEERKYSCRFSLPQKPLREFSHKTFDIITQESLNFTSQEECNPFANFKKQALPKNQFLVEFLPVKGLLQVKYITGLQLGIENTDLLMFQSSSINYHFSAVSIQFVEKGQAKQVKKKDRFLGFKSIIQLMATESPIFHMMLMIDLTMVCAKISQSILRKNIIRPDDYLKIQEVILKVEHMVQLFLKKIDKFYKIVKESESTKKHQ